ncbi:MAG: hypothetical protein WAM69_16345, partial [Candidatus Sulfotelmatobacter sp.]
GTTAERHSCGLRMLANADVRAPPKRASGGLRFPLTKTYMDVGFSLTLQQSFEDVVDDEFGAGLGHNAKLFGIGRVVGHVYYHLGVAITQETPILQAVDTRSGELIERRSS